MLHISPYTSIGTYSLSVNKHIYSHRQMYKNNVISLAIMYYAVHLSVTTYSKGLTNIMFESKMLIFLSSVLVFVLLCVSWCPFKFCNHLGE